MRDEWVRLRYCNFSREPKKVGVASPWKSFHQGLNTLNVSSQVKQDLSCHPSTSKCQKSDIPFSSDSNCLMYL